MACYYPLKGFDTGLKTINNKPKYLIKSYETTMYQPTGELMPYIDIPCGKCVGCRLAYSRTWADRCMAEATLHVNNYFLTLTYDNDNLPYPIDKETGEILTKNWPTLVKRDWQLFMKRLRKNYKYDNNIRFFMAGEYGSQSARPHYHAIVFGLQLDDLQLYKKTGQGFNLYTSEWLNSIWQHQGYIIIADVTWETCAYTARYIMKKQNGDGAEIYEKLNIIPEFTLMSRRPGIGREFYENNKLDYLRFGELNISTSTGGRKIKSVKYFDKLLEIEYPDITKENKEKLQKKMEVIKAKKLENTSKSYLDLLETQENIMQTKVKKLVRKEI